MDAIDVYLTGKERQEIIDICELIWETDTADEHLENGLGSALYKLYKGYVGQEDYEQYANKRRSKQ